MKNLSEDHKEIQSGKKLDDEGYMAKVEMDKIEQSLEKLRKIIKNSKQQLPSWVQSKITKSSDYLDIVADYLASDVKMDENASFSINGESSLVDKILAEMLGDKPGIDIKKTKSLDKIAKKHKVSVEYLEKQLKKGIKIEMEHTTDKGEAEIIALHHLEEIPDYYTRLNKMEKSTEMKEETKSGDSNLGDWFRKSSGTDPKTGRKVAGWVQLGGPFAGAPCARQEGQKSTPKCGSSKMAANLSDEKEEKAFRRKNRKDDNQPQKSGSAKPTYVKTEEVNLQEEKEKNKKDACYHKVKSRYRVWPSAYGSGALVKCRKVGASNWGEKVDEAVRLPMQTGQLLRVLVNWRGKHLSVQMFFPQLGTPKRNEITYAVNQIYPEARVISYVPCEMDSSTPIVQVKEDWQKVNKKDRVDGMSQKAVNTYRRENPGSKLQTAVTEKNPTGGRKQRQTNYCTRSKGQQEMHNISCSKTPDKPICKARRRWNCKN